MSTAAWLWFNLLILSDFSNIWREAELCDTKRDFQPWLLTGARAGAAQSQNPGKKKQQWQSRG
jgi:hypothetical protein